MISFGERAIKIIVKKYFNRTGLPDESLHDCILEDITNNQWVFMKALVLEFHKLKAANLLCGDSSQERYENFFHILETNEYFEYFISSYPVFDKHLHGVISNSLESLEYARDSISHLKFQIENKFNLKIDRIEFIKFVGDRHPGERRNVLVKLGDRKFVIKNRDNSARDVLKKIFITIESHLDQKPYLLEYYAYNGLVVEEWVDDRICGYYAKENAYRFGVISAISVLTRGKDLHHENIINSASRGPVIVDYECFFSPKIYNIDQKLDFALLLMHAGVLPFSIISPVTGKATELGSLLSTLDDESVSPLKLHYLENDFTDDVRLVYKFKEPEDKTSTSRKNIFLPEDALNIIKGFEDACFAISKNIVEIEKIITAKNAKKIYSRFVAKPTQYYYDLARKFFHPKYASDSLLFENLVQEQLKISGSEQIGMIKSEFNSVLIAGSPLLTIGWEDRHITVSSSASGLIAINSCKSSVMDTLNAFSDVDNIYLLSNIIKKALAGKVCVFSEGNFKNIDKKISVDTSKECVKEYISNEISLMLESIISNKSSSVIDLIESGTGGYEVSLVDNGLYAGISGIYYALLISYMATGENRYDEVQQMIHSLYQNMDPKSVNPSVFTGDLGIIYSLLVEREILSTDLNIEKISKLVDVGISKIIKTSNWDLFSGSAGILLLLAKLRSTSLFEISYLEQNAQKIIDHIGNLKVIDQNGLSWWPQPFSERENLGGLAHGVAGVAYSLSFWLDNYKAKTLYREAIRSQESLYLGGGYWLDARNFKNNNQKASNSWCHGSLGIRRLFPSSSDRSIYSTDYFDYTLCHGLSGDIIGCLADFDIEMARNKIKILLSHRLYAADNIISSPDYMINGLFLGRGGVILALSAYVNPDVLKYNCMYLDI